MAIIEIVLSLLTIYSYLQLKIKLYSNWINICQLLTKWPCRCVYPWRQKIKTYRSSPHDAQPYLIWERWSYVTHKYSDAKKL